MFNGTKVTLTCVTRVHSGFPNMVHKLGLNLVMLQQVATRIQRPVPVITTCLYDMNGKCQQSKSEGKQWLSCRGHDEKAESETALKLKNSWCIERCFYK